MASSQQATDVLASVIRTLGGHVGGAEDLEWAKSLPAGKALLEWLAAQIIDVSVPTQEQENYSDRLLSLQASLENIALHDEEIKEVNIAKQFGKVAERECVGIPAQPTDFLRMSTLCSRYERTELEAELLDNETRSLKYRLKSAKIASKQLAQSVKSLRALIKEADDNIQHQGERLGELSVRADTSLSQSISVANKLLRNTDTEREASKAALVASDSHLAQVISLRSKIVASVEEQFRRLDEARRALPIPDEVNREAMRLRNQLVNAKSPSAGPQAAEGSDLATATPIYCRELDKLSQQLEAASSDESRRAILDSILASTSTCHGEGEDIDATDDIDVADELTRAWQLDQATLLTSREKILDEATEMFTRHLIPPLQSLHDNLSAFNDYSFETEALVSALIEEIEETVDDVAAAQVSRSDATGHGSQKAGITPGALLEAELTESLKRMQNMRPPDAGPLILLDRTDLMKELEAARQRLDRAENAEIEWSSTLTGALAPLSSEHSSLLSTIYANSPVNTSPPFALSVDNQAVEKATQQKAAQLTASIAELEKKAKLSTRDNHKLGVFVEKWARV